MAFLIWHILLLQMLFLVGTVFELFFFFLIYFIFLISEINAHQSRSSDLSKEEKNKIWIIHQMCIH